MFCFILFSQLIMQYFSFLFIRQYNWYLININRSVFLWISCQFFCVLSTLFCLFSFMLCVVAFLCRQHSASIFFVFVVFSFVFCLLSKFFSINRFCENS